ncbi:hypothetical protein FO519_004971 [Halicephalobus sp. NKZ332]|nr:hypothetical protein FO519_004971 [Halicephalobus sp. NKZ332]
MADSDSQERQYLFNWDLLLEAEVKSPGSETPVFALFSKVYIDDTSLWISTKIAEMSMEEEQNKLAVNVRRPANYQQLQESSSSNSEADQESTDPDLQMKLAMGIPVSFGAPLSETRKRKKNSKPVDGEAYWRKFNMMFVRGVEELSKLNEDENPETTTFASALKTASASKLLSDHSKLSYFTSLLEKRTATGHIDGISEEELKNTILRDISRYNGLLARNEAESFVKKLQKLHYVPGFPVTMKNAEGKTTKIPSSFEILKPFESVKFKSHPALHEEHKKIDYNLKGEIDLDAPEEDEIVVKKESKEDGDPLNFDFSFDPIRDAHLIAKHALKYFGKNSNIKKYWHQRERLFSKLNDGILLDEESWFSVTPEQIGRHLADRLVTKNCLILDCFTGAGGNAIQFALKGALVYAVDLDPIKIRIARQNAKVYGVEDRITFFCGNAFHVIDSFINSRKNDPSKLPFDVIFLSPPWGGPQYLNAREFTLDMCTPDGFEIFRRASKITENIVYFLPRNTRTSDLLLLAKETKSKKVEVENTQLNGKIKTLNAYYGDLIN